MAHSSSHLNLGIERKRHVPLIVEALRGYAESLLSSLSSGEITDPDEVQKLQSDIDEMGELVAFFDSNEALAERLGQLRGQQMDGPPVSGEWNASSVDGNHEYMMRLLGMDTQEDRLELIAEAKTNGRRRRRRRS